MSWLLGQVDDLENCSLLLVAKDKDVVFVEVAEFGLKHFELLVFHEVMHQDVHIARWLF